MDAIGRGDLNSASQIDRDHYLKFVKPTEDSSAWDWWQQKTFEQRRALTATTLANSPNRIISPSANTFLIIQHNYSGLAHEQQLARNLHQLRNNGIPLKFRVIYLFGLPKAEHVISAQHIYRLDPEAILFAEASDYIDAAKRLDRYIGCGGDIRTVIYITFYVMAFWVSLNVRHPNQKFLQMKYPPLQAGRISEWATGRTSQSNEVEQSGSMWTQLGLLDLKPYGNLTPRRSRDPSSGEITFGSISRVEKTLHPDYTEFIIECLKKNERLVYLYTAKSNEIEKIPEKIKDHPRARNLGWVNPVQAIFTFDIYLETFPWGGGDMSLLALSAKVPYVTLVTDEAERFGIYRFLKFLALQRERAVKASFLTSKDNLLQAVHDLARNPELRNDMANEWLEIVSNYRPIKDIQAWSRFLLE